MEKAETEQRSQKVAMEIILENVRGFFKTGQIPVKPLTVLVGENSTGKSTFMALIAHVLQPLFPSMRPSFNIPPFDLGTFDSIATFKGGRYGRADYFSVGFAEDHKRRGRREINAKYINHKGQPQLHEVEVLGEGGRLFLSVADDNSIASVKVTVRQGEPKEFTFDLREGPSFQSDVPMSFVLSAAVSQATRKSETERKTPPLLPGPEFFQLLELLRAPARSVYALAPVRTKPKRTYDELSGEFDPEGDHIPVLLARLWQDESNDRKDQLLAALDEFGHMSSLFEKVSVRRFGKRPTDPFQVLIALGGPPANLADVGYGVSQALPIVAQSLLVGERGLLLLQQPEVHLHPRAQAALGSFLARIVAAQSKEFVIETHSDYLLDRIRMEVAQGTIQHQDVMVLFFERDGVESHIHPISIDEGGHLIGAPSSYRQFFMQEELNLLTRGSK